MNTAGIMVVRSLAPSHEPEPRTVQHAGHEPGIAGYLLEDAPHLLAGQDHGEPLSGPGAHEGSEVAQFVSQDVVVQEQQCAEGLVLRGSRHPRFSGQVADEAADPHDVGLLGAAGSRFSMAGSPGDLGVQGGPLLYFGSTPPTPGASEPVRHPPP